METSLDDRCAFMRCICGPWPDPKCWQYEHHKMYAGEPGAFPKEAFPKNWTVNDLLKVRAKVRFSLVERIMLLFRPLCIDISVYCEVSPGATSAVSKAWAARWRWPWQHNGEQTVDCEME